MFEDIDIPPALLERADIAAQVLCSQIVSDVQSFINKRIIKTLPENCTLGWRETRGLAHLHTQPQGVTSARLSELTRYSAATISRINLKLLHAGFIILEDHQYDARSTLLKITPSGAAHMERFYAQCSAQHDHIVPRHLSALDEETLRKLVDLLLHLQRRAEILAGIDNFERLKGYDTTRYSKTQFENNYKQYTRFPELLFQMYATRISKDYMTFFTRHAIKPLTARPKIKVRELRVLMCMEYFGETSTSIHIAKTMRYDKATVARAAAQLIADGYITQTGCDMDEREKPLCLTAKGHDAAQEYKLTSLAALHRADQITGEPQDIKTQRRALAALLMLRGRAKVFANIKMSKNSSAA